MESQPHIRLTKFLPGSYQCKAGWYNRWLVRDTCEDVVPRLQGSFAVLIWSSCLWSLGQAQYVVYVEQFTNAE
jgi:hypothetical protein